MKKMSILSLTALAIFVIFAIMLTGASQNVSTRDLLVAPQDLIRAEDTPQLLKLELPTVPSGSNQLPSLKSISPDKLSPQKAGTIVAWTATASDPEGDPLLFQFWLNGPSTGNTWKPMTGWSEAQIWNWTTNEIDTGNNIIDVRIRDGHHANDDKWDSHLSAEYFIESGSIFDPGSKPSLLSLKSDRQSPQDLGARVTWTAMASDSEGDTVLYQYWLKGPSTEEQWTPVSSWTTNNQWTWNTAQTKAGIYTVEIRIRDGYHAGSESADDFIRMPYVLRQSGIIK
jgi:hypothetical protein